jgi:hypothetical protein
MSACRQAVRSTSEKGEQPGSPEKLGGAGRQWPSRSGTARITKDHLTSQGSDKNAAEMKTNRIEMVSGGRFFSHHDDAIVYFDSRHRVTKTKLEGGLMGELVEELQPEDIFTSSDWPKRSYRHQLETVNGGDRVSVIEF